MHDAYPLISAKARRSGCRCLVIALVAITTLVVSFAVYYSRLAARARLHDSLDPFAMIRLEYSLRDYKVDYNRFPIPKDSPTDRDLALRSRGPMLQALIGKESGGLNPRQINFIDLPMAKERKSGLWQDGEEWVLSDQWGEPFYIILDTNGDGKIANPGIGGEAELPTGTFIYSSGKDRDPKTWNDNIYVRPRG